MSSAYLLVSTPTWMKRLLSRSVHSNRMARGWHYAKLSLSNGRRLSFSGMCILLFLFFSLCRFLFVCVSLLLSLELGRCSSDLSVQQTTYRIVCVCVFSSHPFWTSSSLDVPAGVTQEEDHTGFLIHLPSAVRALVFVARRIQPFLSLVDREVEFCVLTN